MKRKVITFLLYAIVFFHWFGIFEPTRELYASINPASGISGSLILIEDLLVVLLGFFSIVTLMTNRSLWKLLEPVLYPIFIFMAIGFFLLVYSISMKGLGDLLGDFRLFAFAVMGIGAAIAFRSEKDIYRFITFILVIWFVDVGYQGFLRWVGEGEFLFGKGKVYVNRMYGFLGFVITPAILLSKRSSEALKIGTGIVLAVYLIIIMLDLTRGVWLAVMLSIAVFSVFEAVSVKRALAFGTAFTFAYIFLSMVFSGSSYGDITVFFPRGLESIYKIGGTAYVRWVAWKILFDRFLQNPILGHGFGAGGSGIDLTFIQFIGQRGLFIGTAHNAHLILLYYIGSVGVMSYIVFTVNLVRKAIRSTDYNSSFLKIVSHLAIAGMAGFFLHMATTPLGPSFHYYFWFYLILLIAVISASRWQKALQDTDKA